MAVVKRKLRNKTPLRVLTACGAVVVIILTAFYLYQLDAFAKHTAKHRRKKAAPHLSPDLLLREPGLRHPQNDIQRKDMDTASIEGSSSEGRRRVAFTLSNLKGGQSGEIVIETVAEWAPIGVEHFWKLIENDFYENCRFFRVLPNFVAQFGISGDPETQLKWRKDVLQDDPVRHTNARGTISYAMSGKNTRTTQIFINLRESGNAYLDKEGFAPIGQVVAGTQYLDEIYDAALEKPKQGMIVNRGNAYLEKEFPDLTYISAVRILDEEDDKESE